MDAVKNPNAMLVITIPTVGSLKETVRGKVADHRNSRKADKIARLENKINKLNEK